MLSLSPPSPAAMMDRMKTQAPPRPSPPARLARRAPMRVAMLAFPDVQVLDVMGPLEVFSRTSRWLRDHGHRPDHAYTVEIVSLKRGPFLTSSGLRLYAEHGMAEVGRGVDTLLIAGGIGVERYRRNAALLRW